jgi:hypothetical protein
MMGRDEMLARVKTEEFCLLWTVLSLPRPLPPENKCTSMVLFLLLFFSFDMLVEIRVCMCASVSVCIFALYFIDNNMLRLTCSEAREEKTTAPCLRGCIVVL